MNLLEEAWKDVLKLARKYNVRPDQLFSYNLLKKLEQKLKENGIEV